MEGGKGRGGVGGVHKTMNITRKHNQNKFLVFKFSVESDIPFRVQMW